jgi:hypothetical protein
LSNAVNVGAASLGWKLAGLGVSMLSFHNDFTCYKNVIVSTTGHCHATFRGILVLTWRAPTPRPLPHHPGTYTALGVFLVENHQDRPHSVIICSRLSLYVTKLSIWIEVLEVSPSSPLVNISSRDQRTSKILVLALPHCLDLHSE